QQQQKQQQQQQQTDVVPNILPPQDRGNTSNMKSKAKKLKTKPEIDKVMIINLENEALFKSIPLSDYLSHPPQLTTTVDPNPNSTFTLGSTPTSYIPASESKRMPYLMGYPNSEVSLITDTQSRLRKREEKNKTIRPYLKFDNNEVKKFVKDTYSKIVTSRDANRWKKLIKSHWGLGTDLKLLERKAGRKIDQLVLQSVYLNTVVPSHADVQKIPKALYPDHDPRFMKMKKAQLEQLRMKAAQDGSYLDEIRYSKKCTSCIIQGFDCSGHKPICSQCYYSSSRVTHSLSRNTSPTNASLPTSCSYPVEGRPLVPLHIYDQLKKQTEEETKIDKDRRLPMEDIQKAISALSVARDDTKDLGWKVNFAGRTLMDRNPASDLDYMIQSSSLKGTTSELLKKVKREPLDEKIEPITKIRDIALKMSKDSESADEMEEETAVDGLKVECVGPLIGKNSKNFSRKQATWVERAVLVEDGPSKNDDGANQTNSSKLPPLKRSKSVYSLKEGVKPLRVTHAGKGWNETILALGQSPKDALNENYNRYRSGWANREYSKAVKKVIEAESLSTNWKVDDLNGKIKKKVDAKLEPAAATAKPNEGAEISNAAAGKGVKQKKRKRIEKEDEGPDVVMVDMGGMNVKKKLKRSSASYYSRLPRRNKIPMYKAKMFKTFRPWIPKKDEKVIPSACDIPETSFLQAISFYASYYFTNIYPCPDVFESMDLTSHIALGMIVQEIISDFAFKLGKESQLEDIEVKQERLDYEKNLQEWNNIVESGGKIPQQNEVEETLKAIMANKKTNRLFAKRFGNEYDRDIADIKGSAAIPSFGDWICGKIINQRDKEYWQTEQLRKREMKADGLDGGVSDGDDEENLGSGARTRHTSNNENVVDHDYWNELRYLMQLRFKPDTLYPERVLVNGYDSDKGRNKDDDVNDDDDDDDAGIDYERFNLRDYDSSAYNINNAYSSLSDSDDTRATPEKLQSRPSFTFGTDEEDFSENDFVYRDSDSDEDDRNKDSSPIPWSIYRPNPDGSDSDIESSDLDLNRKGTKRGDDYNMNPEFVILDNDDDADDDADDEDDGVADISFELESKPKSIVDSSKVDGSMDELDPDLDKNTNESEGSDEESIRPIKARSPTPPALTQTPTAHQKPKDIVSDSEKNSDSETEDVEEDDLPLSSSILTALSDTRFGKMFGRGHEEYSDDEDEEDGYGGNNEVVSQVVLDDSSSSEDERNIVRPSVSESDEED
ncbi:hypothetical protein BGZ76_009037, partial [Entomortierella beljakovae]